MLHQAAAPGGLTVERRAPSEDLGRQVEFYWIVSWRLDGEPPHEQQVLAHPNVHLVFEAPAGRLYGVQRGLFVRRLTGSGQVLGVKFRPGAARPLLGFPVADLADRAVPLAELFGPAAAGVTSRVLAAGDVPAMAEQAERFLRDLLPEPDPVAEQVAAIVGRITDSPALFRVDQLAAELGLSVRSVQRLFAEYVGAAPKWVLRRARLHEAATRAEQGTGVDWAALAAELGYADQAHLTRDFTAAVGVSPAAYAKGR
ncbi:helix-turn-helix domain-containing protein [Kitasatospora sp. RB6PN24]|uniref:helix-turn-helix domain-containing protein n=1 Tax=Kitasatospora humi TaxID=2893891 RepID=UPI001E3F24A6|nr:helix-turn-helix domain-containing protein [Kitasatospora humi]MCC9308418.1 helix-turn-helix domain-containing protein [Kitasatospora humi]